MLAGKLPQEIHPKAEGVIAAQEGHRILILPVVGVSELRNVGGPAKDLNSGNGIVGQVFVESIGGYLAKIEPDASIVEAEFVGPPWTDDIGVGKQPPHGAAVEAVVKSREIV